MVFFIATNLGPLTTEMGHAVGFQFPEGATMISGIDMSSHITLWIILKLLDYKNTPMFIAGILALLAYAGMWYWTRNDIKKQYENEKKVADICHGVCGLLNVTLASGEYLVKDKKLTGFSRAEEILARKERVVPFDLETELKDRGARYEKALIPMTSKVVIDGNLFTGENPFSSKKMAEVILQCFSKK